ncbi:MAG: hypothetical protein ACXABX_10190 [Candidatus Thorarchaeota archaeon]|jgi:hypothetical protein
MSKSRKKKSGKTQVSGQTLGALALVLSIVALGFSVYQFISTPQEPQFYILERDDLIWLDRYSSYDYLNELNITYSTNVGDTVVLEFSCQLYLDPVGTTTLTVNFDVNGTIFPSSSIYLSGDSVSLASDYMKYTYEASTAGENYLVIYTTCDDETDNYIRDCLLTVTVY